MVPTKVVIADDHTLFREGIKRMLSLEKDILVVGEASRGDEVTKLVERTKPDVLLLDLKMPKGDIVQTLLEVKDMNPATKVLVLTAFSEDENILNAAKGGARGYVLKGIDFPTLYEPSRPSRAAVCGSTKSCLRPTCLRKLPKTNLMIASMPEKTMRPSRR